MRVIRHQTVRVEELSSVRHRIGEDAQIAEPILIVEEDWAPVVSTLRDVEEGSRNVSSWGSSHGRNMPLLSSRIDTAFASRLPGRNGVRSRTGLGGEPQ